MTHKKGAKDEREDEPLVIEVQNQITQPDPEDNIFLEDSFEDDNRYEEKYKVFTELVRGTRYEQYAGNTTSLWAFDSLLSDSSSGKKRITARYHNDFDEEELGDDDDNKKDIDNRRFEIEAYFINSVDLETLIKVLEVANVEIEEPEEYERIRFKLKIYKDEDDVAFHECYHPHYSSYNIVVGNKYDDNIDTNGTLLGIRAIRSHLLFNTDTNEYVLADGRYWCI